MEDIEEANTPLTKPKKPRSEKQIEAFKNAMQKRAESIAKKKDEQIYQSAKLLIEKQQKVQVIDDQTDSEPEPVKKSKSKKQIDIKPKYKPKKKISIESESDTDTSESESESSESSDSEPEFIIKSRSRKKTKPKKYEPNTRVKRSEPLNDPVHNHPAKSNTDYNVYFV